MISLFGRNNNVHYIQVFYNRQLITRYYNALRLYSLLAETKQYAMALKTADALSLPIIMH